MASKTFTTFYFSFIALIFYITMCPRPLSIGPTNGEYFLAEGEESIVTAPSNTQIILARVLKGTGKFVFHGQPLPSHIGHIRAVAFDTIQNTYIFSGGLPNKLISFNKECHSFEIIVDDVVYVTSMDTDPYRNLLHLVDAGKKTKEIMDLRTYKRKVVEENVLYNDIGLRLTELPKIPLNNPYLQKEKMLGKVFAKTKWFTGKTPESVFLGRNSETDTMIYATWDGYRVTIEKNVGNVGYVGNLNELEIEGNMKDIIYVSNHNGFAVVAI